MDRIEYFTGKEVAKLLRLSVTWLQHKRLEGGGPPFVHIGRSVRYPVADLVAWCRALKALPGSEK